MASLSFIEELANSYIHLKEEETYIWRNIHVRQFRKKAASSRPLKISIISQPVCVLPGDTDQQEMIPSKKSAVLVDGVVLNGPTTDAKAGEKFVEEACRLIMEEVVLKATDVNEKVCEWRPPEQLKQLLDLEMRDSGEPPHRLLELCRDVIRYSVKTNHPRFFNQLYAGLDYYSLVARFMTEALNPKETLVQAE
ncbi:Acidic amino acid decarboxylase gadl1 [Saguinus oedipus]|uniref:Acidic amino acid decarboxylase gadl1 n=1 Tax=Saguinus oedipus TaxID=9490 RepID=A0ABQ9TZH8_SAGOE|nr:Acidic amino acid decarboxylase gadl1 [Saguinus oedipus]